MDGDLASVKPFTSFNDPYFKDNVDESIARSWYDGDWPKHPWEEDTDPKYTDFEDDGKYTWLKAPRFQGKPMQVGPLAQMLVGYAQGHEEIVKRVNALLPGQHHCRHPGRSGRPAFHHRPSCCPGDTCGMMADLALKHWELLVDNIGRGDT